MKSKIEANYLLKNYLSDINIIDEIFITLDKNKMIKNGENYRQYTYDLVELEKSSYYMALCNINKNLIITFIENETTLNCQFLVTSKDVFENLKIEDFTKYVDYEIADILLSYFN